MSDKKILYISFDGLLDPLGQSQILPYLNFIKKFGKLTCLSIEKKIDKKNNFKKKFNWKYILFSKKIFYFSKFYDFTKILLFSIIICKKEKINIIHCRGHLPALVAFFIKKIFSIKIIFDFRGFWIDERVDNGTLNLKIFYHWIIYVILKFLEKKVILNSDSFVFLTQFAADEVKKISKKNFFYQIIPCAADYNLFKKKNKIKNQNLFCYLGSLGTVYMLDEMLNFFIFLNKFNKNLKFMMITNNEEFLKNNFLYEKNNFLKKNLIIKNLKRDQIPKYLNYCTYAVSFIRPTYARNSSFPTKIGELLAMNIPIVYNIGLKGVDDFFLKNKLGIGIKIKKKYTKNDIRKILKSLKLIRYTNLRLISKKTLGLDLAIKKYKKIYAEL